MGRTYDFSLESELMQTDYDSDNTLPMKWRIMRQIAGMLRLKVRMVGSNVSVLRTRMLRSEAHEKATGKTLRARREFDEPKFWKSMAGPSMVEKRVQHSEVMRSGQVHR